MHGETAEAESGRRPKSRNRRYLAILVIVHRRSLPRCITCSPAQRAEAAAPAAASAPKRGPVPVLAAAATTADVPVYLDAVGTIKALNTVTVSPQVDGKLISVGFKEGQDVKKGDVLARIDPTTYQAQLDQAEAKKAQDEALLANAKLDLDRYKKLAATNAINRQQADTQRAAGRAARGAGASPIRRRSRTRGRRSATPPSSRRSTAAPASARSTKAISCTRRTPPASW